MRAFAATSARTPGLPSPVRAGSAITTSNRCFSSGFQCITSRGTIVALRPARFTRLSPTDDFEYSTVTTCELGDVAASANSPTPEYASSTRRARSSSGAARFTASTSSSAAAGPLWKNDAADTLNW